MIQISEAEYERLKRRAGVVRPNRQERLPPPRAVNDPALELTVEYVEKVNTRGPHSLEARLIRDWLRMYRQLTVGGE